jgi:hypothetical protein
VSHHSPGFDGALTASCCSVLFKELKGFNAIKEQSKTCQFLLQEDDKQNLVNIFERVNEARQNMIVRALALL